MTCNRVSGTGSGAQAPAPSVLIEEEQPRGPEPGQGSTDNILIRYYVPWPLPQAF